MNRDSDLGYWLDLTATVLLALATTASAWSAYQAARRGGVQAFSLTESNLARTAAIGQSDRANQLVTIDVGLFVQYVAAESRGDGKLTLFLEKRFRPELKTAFKAWLAQDPLHNPNAPSSPFVMREYHSADREEAARLNAAANHKLDYAKKANQQSDNYVMLTVLFASVLFFAGICTKPYRWSMRIALLVFGLLLFICTLAVLVAYPVH